ncbi:UDP-N-acetylglucosamine 4,6-dehydratase (inverting) [Pseudodesulfovibrio sp. JC047]|uniref:UDP-N-acetylglucosamine 4,6-dehydratase (inverting) n=1 Tax=Pseudodesulfovibrio sp. JC047 TaxID=2683199 RepID=UPI0013D4B675|nr:UDP-N-acetylglucosamine 4,6-dehydratase (inverting) [Pseudodesulfovibrio sp. JC047]NDV20638.1 UDP-N-acetylglucosamine 4,6-dehydratase (inverting) [Pseudodesulfovibrio sp. JC047]
MFNGSNILVTGATGSFGQSFVENILNTYTPNKLIIFSRDELKQFQMEQRFSDKEYPCLRYFLGDIRDERRLRIALKGVDYVVHAAALKQVPAAEYNPFEFIQTNVIGAQNLIETAIECNVKKVLALSTDKAVNPLNLYGATKLCSDKLFIAGNAYSGQYGTRFSVVRYGNVLGSRGSVLPVFMKYRDSGSIPVTDPRMTRFWIRIEDGVHFCLDRMKTMVGGEIFVPKLPTMNIVDLAKTVCPDCEIDVVGIRPGEKIHEVLIPKDEARNTLEYEKYYTILPPRRYGTQEEYTQEGIPVPDDFEYESSSKEWLLSQDEFRRILDAYETKDAK